MVETSYYKGKARNLAILLTLLFVGTILTILLLIILRTPIPPYPEGGGGIGNGIELNLGFSDAGMGNNPQELSMAEKEVPKPETQVKADEELLKQDIEDAPSINEKIDKKVKKDVKKDVAPKKETKKEPIKREPVVNSAALYQNAKRNKSADGDKNVAGDQGNPSGSLGAKAFGNKGGQGGSGGGTGGGTGTGTGPGSGSGVSSFSLAGRNSVGALPAPEYKKQSEGVVVVAVVVDKEGKVTQAEPGQKGTTATDDILWEAAKQAALKARFDRKPDAAAFQKGTITYRFRLQ
jgi:TonB family protein